ncbi:phospholipase D-like domain-containing protein [Paenibacillus montanisoli]|uniref:phospholipase D n=1 Tax=Paenibacillus montanisoli TaxID=2081970 RepID=A0A328U4S1_9BACL|nr:phospholipase D-like domain-containing protein [Paenibacillus montanisoli]RAP77797.1 phospholipase D family protein [Paenibacillus montanisoli]
MKAINYALSVLLVVFSATACSIYASPSSQTTAVKDIEAEWAFTQDGGHPDQLLIRIINGAETTLDIAIYSLTKPDIVDAIKKAKKRGVKVRLITDRTQARGKTQKEALKLLGSAGIPMKVNKHSGLMHLKMTIADGENATTGSFNYSKSASTDNDEVLMVLRNSEVAKSFAEQFQAMWDDTEGFEAITPIIAEDALKVNGTADGTEASDAPVAAQPDGVIYRSCAEVKAAGKAPLRKSDPGYSTKLDGDKDGIACER